MPICFSANGAPVESSAPPMSRLLDVLREELRLTGTKEGCGEGECGACTVLIDGEVANACLVPLAQCHKAAVTTVEGLADPDGRLAPVQRAFIDLGATQCGICTPGFLMSASALLARDPHPTRAAVREALSGNLCRCTGYQKIVDAVTSALGAP